MGKTTIKSDKYGLYTRFGGYVWRPIFPSGLNLAKLVDCSQELIDDIYEVFHNDITNYQNFKTQFKEGDIIRGYHRQAGPFGTLTNLDKTIHEEWYSHGSYIRNTNDRRLGYINSEELYCGGFFSWNI